MSTVAVKDHHGSLYKSAKRGVSNIFRTGPGFSLPLFCRLALNRILNFWHVQIYHS